MRALTFALRAVFFAALFVAFAYPALQTAAIVAMSLAVVTLIAVRWLGPTHGRPRPAFT